MTVLPDRDAVEHADSVGYAVPVVDLAVAPIGDDPTVGELLARGPNVTREYWRRLEETAATIVDGWLRTGDIVRVDDDGRVHIVDRAKDIINRGGENVASVEVEDALASAPGVAEAAVIAVPDEVMGEKVGAVLVGIEGRSGRRRRPRALPAAAGRLQGAAVRRLVPGPLPRNAGGKLVKGSCGAASTGARHCADLRRHGEARGLERTLDRAVAHVCARDRRVAESAAVEPFISREEVIVLVAPACRDRAEKRADTAMA